MTIELPIQWEVRERQQVDRLYQEEFEPLVRFVIAVRGLSLGSAEDVAQEAFIRLMQHPPRDWRKCKSWLRTTAIRLAADMKRSTERFRQKAEEFGVTRNDTEHSAETQYLTALDQEKVHAALSALSETEGRALHLRMSGFAYREIANTLGLEEKQMGVFLWRAMTKLRRRYTDQTAAEDLEGGVHG